MARDIEAIKNQLRKLKQYKNLSEEELNQKAEEKRKQEEVVDAISFLTDEGEKKFAAHGLGLIPTKVIVTMYNSGAYTIVEGTHTSTNCVITATTGCKYKVLAQF